MLRRILLACGVLGSLLYVAVDIVAAIAYPDYHSFSSRAISELMASGAPTERLVDPLFLLYDALLIAFAVGVWMSGSGRRLHVCAVLLFAYGAIGLLGPTVAEMNVRGSRGPESADQVHIALTGILVVSMFAAIATVASLRQRWFQLYSYATMLVMLVFGVLTGIAMRGIEAGEATPWVGIVERIDVGAFLLWVAVFAISLARTPGGNMPAARQRGELLRDRHAHGTNAARISTWIMLSSGPRPPRLRASS